MEKKNNRLVSGLILLIIIILLVMFGIYGVYTQGLIFNNNSVEENNNINEIEDIEVEVTSTDEKTKLEEIINLFNNLSFSGATKNIEIYNNLNLTNEEKLQVVLIKLSDGFTDITVSKDKINISNMELVDFFDSMKSKQISVNRIEKEYYDLFNEKLSSYQDIAGCPSFYYDDTNKVYYSYSACGGSGLIRNITYINKYTSKGDEVYVYMSAGYIEYTDEYYNEVNVYTDFNKTKLYKTESVYNEHITQTNYVDFSEYKYTFSKREDGTYYFKSIEKTR